MNDNFAFLEQNTNDEAIKTVLKDHPDLRLLWERRHLIESPIVINDVNPILHILVEAIVERQIMEDEPTEVKAALERLKKRERSHHAARSLIATIFINCLFDTLKGNKPFDSQKYSKQLAMLVVNTIRPGKVGRNDPCPCGSGKKYKRCCLEMVGSEMPLQRNFDSEAEVDEKLILGAGHYATIDYLTHTNPDDPVIFMENRCIISAFLKEKGDMEGAYIALKENVDFAKELGELGLTNNAYYDLLDFCLNNSDEFAEAGIEVIENFLPLLAEKEKGNLRCDKADLLAKMNKIDDAEKEFAAIFKEMPEWYFGRYRYALYLEDIGKKSEAIEVLKQLISIKDKLDQETYDAAVEVLESMQ
jgi:hypothetical protein